MRQRKRAGGYVMPNQPLGPALPPYAEYAYYALILNSIMATAWGIDVPLLGTGAMALLAIYCMRRLKGPFSPVYEPVRLPVACAISFILIQIFVHDQSLMVSDNRSFVTWVIQLIIIQSVFLRAGFLNRFAIAAFLIGLSLLPHLNLNYGDSLGEVERAGLESGVGYANPNDLAAWFGFCCVYFGVLGIENRRNLVRLCAFVAAAACLFVVALTVSRSTLLAVSIAGIVASRRSLKRGFLPVLLLVIVGGGVLVSGVFDQSISFFLERGTEETGRFLVWPLALERIFDSPFSGVGIDKIGTWIPETGGVITPHNVFLYVGLASGIIPLTFFMAYWFKALRGALQLSQRGLQDAPFQLPLVIYTSIIASFGAGVFTYPWAMVALCNAMPQPETRRLRVLRVTQDKPLQASSGADEANSASKNYPPFVHPAARR